MLTKSGLKLGISLPQALEDGVTDTRLITDYARRAEDAGFDDLWTIDQTTGRFPTLECLALLSYVAASTTRIRLGTAVIVSNQRNPLQLAKQITSLDHLSNGRLTVGIGLGNTSDLYPAFGMGRERRVARFVESIKVLKALWADGAATLDGDFWKLDAVPMEPKPVQKPHPPLWFGAHSEAAMQRAARFGDGWMGAGGTPIDQYYVEVARMREIVEQHGRDPRHFPFSKRVYMAVHQDSAKARAMVEDWLQRFYGGLDETPNDWAIYGSPDQMVDTLSRMRDAGLSHLMLNPTPSDLDQLELIAARVAPQL